MSCLPCLDQGFPGQLAFARHRCCQGFPSIAKGLCHFPSGKHRHFHSLAGWSSLHRIWLRAGQSEGACHYCLQEPCCLPSWQHSFCKPDGCQDHRHSAPCRPNRPTCLHEGCQLLLGKQNLPESCDAKFLLVVVIRRLIS